MTRPPVTLVHSPALGPASWLGVAEALSARGWVCLIPSMLEATSAADHVQAARLGALDGDSVLVGHSGAGPLLPAVHPRATAFVFVDAGIPGTGSSTPLAPPDLLRHLHAIANNGILPPWSRWWGDGAFERLVPEATTRARLAPEMRRLPVALYESSSPIPTGWPQSPCAYLRLSDAYRAEAAEAHQRGWTVSELDGAHLDIATRPGVVADALDRLLEPFT